MVGRHLQQYPGLAAEIAALGHQVGVHTYDHLSVQGQLLTNGGDVVRQMALTGTLMPNSIDYPIYFRPPYGDWSGAVAQAMNADFLTCLTTFGPINWDNGASDWDKWRDGVAPSLVADNYMNDITSTMGGRGIVLMHDSTADLGPLRGVNQALALARILVPRLKSSGFNLVRLDAVEGLASQAALPTGIALQHASGKYVSPRGGGNGPIFIDGPAPGDWEKLTAIMLGSNCLALRAPGGQYFSLQNTATKSVTATATTIGDWETFEVVPFPNGMIVFRTFTGGFLTAGASSVLELVGTGPADASSQFSFFRY